MKKTGWLVVGLLVLGPGAFAATPPLPASRAVAPPAGEDGIASTEGEQTLQGTFVWAREDGDLSGELKARFQSTEAGKWNVTFHFTWENEPKVWTGTAEGSLTEGELHGTVMDDGKENTFRFTGTFEDGTFQGTHAHVSKEGKESRTGTLTLTR